MDQANLIMCQVWWSYKVFYYPLKINGSSWSDQFGGAMKGPSSRSKPVYEVDLSRSLFGGAMKGPIIC